MFFLLRYLFGVNLYAADICYFSFNNEKEFIEAEKMAKQLNKFSSEEIRIWEYQTEGDRPENSFQKMLDSGQSCDALVLSGHHTGSFGGKRARGELGIDFLEKLSCDPRYKGFFDNIKGVWLQGCRTLGQSIAGDSFDNEENHANFHRDRVGAVLAEDHLEQGFAQLEMEFSDTLDQENPLSSRYLRLFPRATVFGWTRTAPGEKAGSQYSLLWHLAHMGRLSDDRKKYFEDPGKELTNEAALHYAKTMMLFFDRENLLGTTCSQYYEKLAADAWLFHGQAKVDDYGNPLPLSYLNPDLQAYPSLDSTGNPLLKLAKEMDCLLKNPNISLEQLIYILDTILQDERLLGYNFNSLVEVVKKYREKGGDEWEQLLSYLKGSDLLSHFIGTKLTSPVTGILRKIDYYAFYRLLGIPQKYRENIEKAIWTAASKALTESVESQDYNRRDYMQTLLQSLIKHDILNTEQYEELIEKSRNNIVVGIIAVNMGSISDKPRILKKILSSDKTNGVTLELVSYELGNHGKQPVEGISEMLKQILSSDKANKYTWSGVAYAIGAHKGPVEGASAMLKEILTFGKGDVVISESVANAVGNHDGPVEGASEIFKDILSSGVASEAVAYAIGNHREPVEGASLMLRQILSEDKGKGAVFEAVASAIGNHKGPIKGDLEMIKEIISSEKADGYALAAAAHTIGKKKKFRGEVSEMLQQILSSKKVNKYTVEAVINAVETAQYSIERREKILETAKENVGSVKAFAPSVAGGV